MHQLVLRELLPHALEHVVWSMSLGFLTPNYRNDSNAARSSAANSSGCSREFPHITLPVLIMHGTDDKATVCRGSQFFYETAGSRDKTLKLYEGHYHDLLNDLGKEAVMNDVKGWIDSHLPRA